MVKSRHALIFILILTSLGAVSLALTTRWGVGASPDSVVYVGAARMIASGKGYSYPAWSGQGEPVTHFPPFFSLVLALGEGLGIDPLQGARWLNLLLYLANSVFFGLALLRHGKKPAWLPIFGTFLALTAIPVLKIHSMAWSEPMFLLLGFLSLYLLAEHIQTRNRFLLFASAFLAGLALLTRYAGVVIIGAGFIGTITLGSSTLRRRMATGITYGALAILPGIVWILRNQSVSGTATNREIVFHPLSASKLAEGATTLAGWMLIPASLPPPLISGIVVTLATCAVVVGYFFVHRFESQNHLSLREQLQHMPVFHGLIGIFVLAYFGFLALSISFLDANTPLDDRILVPIFWGGSLLFLLFLMRLAENAPRRVSWILFVVLALFSGGYGLLATKFELNGFRQGIGLNSLTWQQSATIAEARQLPVGTPIYSNAAEAIYLHTGHPALRIPRKIELVTGQTNPEYEKILQDIREAISQQNGALVYFDFFQPPGYPTANELAEIFPLRVLSKSTDGTIYAAGNAPWSAKPVILAPVNNFRLHRNSTRMLCSDH